MAINQTTRQIRLPEKTSPVVVHPPLRWLQHFGPSSGGGFGPGLDLLENLWKN